MQEAGLELAGAPLRGVLTSGMRHASTTSPQDRVAMADRIPQSRPISFTMQMPAPQALTDTVVLMIVHSHSWRVSPLSH